MSIARASTLDRDSCRRDQADPSKIDATEALEEFEGVLKRNGDVDRRREVLAALRRWRWDEMLSQGTRERVTDLLRRFDN